MAPLYRGGRGAGGGGGPSIPPPPPSRPGHCQVHACPPQHTAEGRLHAGEQTGPTDLCQAMEAVTWTTHSSTVWRPTDRHSRGREQREGGWQDRAWMERPQDRWVEHRWGRWTDKWKDGGWTNRRVDGWMARHTAGWLDGQKDVRAGEGGCVDGTEQLWRGQ